MQFLSPLDSVFLRMESVRTPMHVGALMTFKLPDGAPPDFVRRLMQLMRDNPFMPPPFDCRIKPGPLSHVAPAWERTKLDMDYHLRHSALPFPGGEKELGILIARLHSHPLDLSRPVWECHLIEGLENRRFALYFKAHHCAIDGMGAMRMVQTWLSKDPTSMQGLGPWPQNNKRKSAEDDAPKTLFDRFRKPAKAAADQARGVRELIKGLNKMLRGKESGTRMSMRTPRSLFNVRVSQQRRLGTQILDLNRIKAVASVSHGSVNDVLLAVCSGAIHRYLNERSALPKRSLLASVPVALARSADQGGNAVTGFVTPLGTELDAPHERIGLINRVTARTKQELMEMPKESLNQMALLGLAPFLIGQVTGTLPKIPPLFNFVVSNVVLSKEPLYLMGAELEAMYPVSFLFDGYALNITLVGYRDAVAVGFLGCREAIPHLQRLAVYTTDALAELEQAVGITPPPAAVSAATVKPARKRSGTRAKAQASA